MTDLTTMEGCVDAGVDIFARVYDGLDQAYAAALELQALVDAGKDLGMVGQLKHDELVARSQQLAGAIATAKVLKQGLHTDMTDIAVELGVDHPVARSGGR